VRYVVFAESFGPEETGKFMASSFNKGVGFYSAGDAEFKKLSDTQTPEGVLAVCEIPPCSFSGIFEKPVKKLFLLLDSVSDPGNLGTVIRTADNFGVSAVFLTPDSVYEYGGKVIRSTMGSFRNVPVIRIAPDGYAAFAEKIKESGTLIISSELAAASPVSDIGKHLAGRNYNNLMLVAGSESHGIKTPEIIALLKNTQGVIRTKIPCRGRNESLNLSAAAAIYCYELDKYIRQ